MEKGKKTSMAVVGVSEAERITQSALGNMGRWQLGICLLMAALKLPISWNQLAIVFIAAPVEFHCAGNDYNGSNAMDNAAQQCVANDSTPCQHWVYDRSVFEDTIASEWNLVCSRSQLVNVAQMTSMIGILLGNIVFSTAADRIGRKTPLVLSGIIQMVVGVCVAFVPWFYGFLFLRLVQAVAVGGTMTISFVLCMEVLNGKWRTTMATLTHLPFNIGTMVMAAIAYNLRHWRQFQMAISLPCIVIVAYWWLVPESPRWLIAVNRNKEALQILQTAAKANNNPIPKSLPEKSIIEEKNAEGKEPTTVNILDLFRTPNMRKKTLIVWFNWFSCGICFFGLEQYIAHTGGNIFFNVALSGLCASPGVFLTIYMMDKFGRRITLLLANVVASLACFSITALPYGTDVLQWVHIACIMTGVAATGVAFSTIYLYSGELFPTVVRNIGVGSGSVWARVGSMIAPFVISMRFLYHNLPPLIFGSAAIIAALVAYGLPETLNSDLPVTLEDGELFGKRVDEESENGVCNAGYRAGVGDC